MKIYWAIVVVAWATKFYAMIPDNPSKNPPLSSSQLTFPQLLKVIKQRAERRAEQPPKQLLMKPPSQSTPPIAIETSEEVDLYPLICGVRICTLSRTNNHNN